MTPSGLAPERRLATLHERVAALLDEHEPDAVALEALYFGQNVRTAFAVGQARGAVLLATDAAIAKKIDKAVFPGEQGGPHVNVFAALALTMYLTRRVDWYSIGEVK